MFGDINVKFRLHGADYNIEFSYNSTPQDFLERFVQITRNDPYTYNFTLEGKNILDSETIVQAASNPLTDFEIECTSKKNVKRTAIFLTVNLENGKSKKINFELNVNSKDYIKAIGLYFKIDPSEVQLKKIGQDKYEMMKKMFSFDASINGQIYQIIYSENATVLDLKYYASFASNYSCSIFSIGGVEYRNSLLFSSIADQKGDKLFEKFSHKIFFKLTDDNQIQEAILEGSAIGRNVKIAIAKATNQKVSEMLDDFLSIDYNGVHIQIDNFVKFDINTISESEYFVLGSPIELILNIKFGEDVLDPIQKLYDPHVTVGQLRKRISQMYQIDSPDFVSIVDSSGYLPIDTQKLSDFASDGSILTITISPLQEIEPCFILYNNKAIKQIKIGLNETNSSVLKLAAKSFNIDPETVCLWLDNVQLTGSERFVKNYLSSAIFKLAAKLKVQIIYEDNTSTFLFPLDIEFDAVAAICSFKYGKSKDSIGFYTESSESLLPVYQPWNGPLIPNKQYIARYRSSDDRSLVKLVMKLRSETTNDQDKTPVNVVIYENGKFVKDTLAALYTDPLSILFTQNALKKHKKGLDKNSMIFINGQLYRPTKIIGELLCIQKDLVITVFPAGTYMYLLPDDDKEDVKYIETEPELTINELMKMIYKSSRSFSILHNGQLIIDTTQLVQFFDPQIPFKIVIDKEAEYELIYQKITEEDDEEKEEIISTKMAVNKETTVHELLVACCDLLKQKAGQKNIKTTQIRVTINSETLTKEIENCKLLSRFGDSEKVEILLLQKFCFTIQSGNLLTFHFSPNDTIHYAKLVVLRRLQAQEQDIEFYYLLYKSISVNEDDHLRDYLEDDELCFDIVPIQCTSKATFYFPEFTHEFVFSKDIIMYELKEYFITFYGLQDPDLIEFIDKSTDEVIDENENPTEDQEIEVKINAPKAKLTRHYSQVYTKKRVKSIKTLKKTIAVDINDSGLTFNCLFRNNDDSSDFSLKLNSDITCLQAKSLIIDYLSSKKKKSSQILEPENLLISINNEKIADSELLKPKYTAEINKISGSKFIVEINRCFGFSTD